MKVVRNIHKQDANAAPIPESNYLKNRIGFWALVIAVNSKNNTVTVVSDTGYELINIPVVSGEWVTVDNNKSYIPSQRNLPPVNSRVFVLTPTYTAVGAFVLCSGFSRGDENIRTLWAKDDNEVQDKNNCRELKTQGGWDITEEYANGNYKAASNDGNIIFQANPVEDSNKSQNKEVSINAWGNNIVINEDGITITDANDNTIEASDDGLIIKNKIDDKFNTIQLKSSGIIITDINGNKIQFSVTGTSPNQKNKIEITNGENNSSIVMNDKKVTINNHLEVSV